ncbi:hypothetical protein VTH82DRAFT_3113 [Thermothelomyces myriococcoides]
MASYDIAQYLLDRANIHDTVTKVPLYYDTINIKGLESEVYAPSIEIDYTSIMGGTPYTISRAEWIEQADGLLHKFASSQHITTGIITNLPQPGANATRPDNATVFAQATGSMVGKAESSDGKPQFVQNGGLLEVGLVRDAELERQGQNPWRITKYKFTKKWNRGSVLDITGN